MSLGGKGCSNEQTLNTRGKIGGEDNPPFKNTSKKFPSDKILSNEKIDTKKSYYYRFTLNH